MTPSSTTKVRPCYNFRDTGTCRFGNRCRYSHDLSAAAIEPPSRATARHPAALVNIDQARQHELMESPAAHTLQTVVSGAIVTLGAGLNVHHIVTGFECCKIVVKNLPRNVRPEELVPLFVESGLDQTQFYVENQTRTRTGQEITVIAHGDNAQALMNRVDNMELRGEPLEIEMGVYNGMGGMGNSDQGQRSKLKITFFAPSSRFVAEYSHRTLAEQDSRELNGSVFGGRKVRITPRSSKSIALNNLPPDYADDPTSLFDSFSAIRLLPLPAQNFDVDDAITSIQNIITMHHPDAQVSTLNRGDTTGVVTLSVAGLDDHERTILRDQLEAQHFDFLGPTKLRIYLPDPMHFTIVIPTAQYRAQATVWRELGEGIKGASACRLTTQELPYGGGHRIQVSGSDKAAVGALKVRVEGVAVGTTCPGWHQSLAGSPQRILNALEAVGAWLKVDFRQRSFKIYGPPRAMQDALTILEHEIETLNAEEQTMNIPRAATGHFLSQGFDEVKATFGEESVLFDIATRVATFKGGDDIRLAIQRITEEAMTSSATTSKMTDDDVLCQICYTTPTAPRTVMCQHVYCAGCLRHLFASATDADRIPMLCMGDEDRCRAPFPIPVIKEFLPKQAFDKLLELAFTSHVDKRPDEFRRCGTPGCDQIYRRQRTPAKLSCPSCFSDVCAACGDEAHVGISCEEHRRRNDKGEHERLTQEYFRTQADIKPCPRCSVPVFRTEGCNHMECRCGIHFCWRCLASFVTSDETYAHMRAAHGGIFDEQMRPEPAAIRQPAIAVPLYEPPRNALNPYFGVDYREQEQVLREAAERRRLQQEREIRARQLAEERERQEQQRQEQQRREQEGAEREAAERQRLQREGEIRAREQAEERQRLQQEERARQLQAEERQRQERETEAQRQAAEQQGQTLYRSYLQQQQIRYRPAPAPARDEGSWCAIM